LFQKHSKNCELKSAIYNVYKAKRNAEVANGVGKETEVLVLDGNKLHPLCEDKLKVLEKIYDEELKHGTEHQDLNNIFPLDSYEKRG
jgi:hypothetical protein